MTNENQPIDNPPIIEAIIDIDCDLAPGLDLSELMERAKKVFQADYPIAREKLVEEHAIEKKENEPAKHSVKRGLAALQFVTEDERQLVQLRPTGYSFNRLNPYTSFDDYLPLIRETWNHFIELCEPLLVRKVSIRMINKVLLPVENGKVALQDFLKIPPRLPQTDYSLDFTGFFEQHAFSDHSTGNKGTIIKTVNGVDSASAPLILDTEVSHNGEIEPKDWEAIDARLASLRSLKNQIFKNTLQDRCLNQS